VPVEIKLSDNIDAAVSEIEHGADLFLQALAEATRGRFQDNVHVNSGATSASASVITAHGSDYAESVGRAAALNPKANFAPEATVRPQEAIVQVPIGYAAIDELGTSRRAGRPALLPACESVAADAENIAREVFKL
jgi:hypothetical protein